jgi:hypothetical protein
MELALFIEALFEGMLGIDFEGGSPSFKDPILDQLVEMASRIDFISANKQVLFPSDDRNRLLLWGH